MWIELAFGLGLGLSWTQLPLAPPLSLGGLGEARLSLAGWAVKPTLALEGSGSMDACSPSGCRRLLAVVGSVGVPVNVWTVRPSFGVGFGYPLWEVGIHLETDVGPGPTAWTTTEAEVGFKLAWLDDRVGGGWVELRLRLASCPIRCRERRAADGAAPSR